MDDMQASSWSDAPRQLQGGDAQSCATEPVAHLAERRVEARQQAGLQRRVEGVHDHRSGAATGAVRGSAPRRAVHLKVVLVVAAGLPQLWRIQQVVT